MVVEFWQCSQRPGQNSAGQPQEGWRANNSRLKYETFGTEIFVEKLLIRKKHALDGQLALDAGQDVYTLNKKLANKIFGYLFSEMRGKIVHYNLKKYNLNEKFDFVLGT